MKTWIKYGLIGVVVLIVIELIMFIVSIFAQWELINPILYLFMIIRFISPFTNLFINIIFSILLFFIIGAIIGLIVSKIRRKR